MSVRAGNEFVKGHACYHGNEARDSKGRSGKAGKVSQCELAFAVEKEQKTMCELRRS